MGDIGFFKVLSEGAVAAGVRRLEAVTGVAAEAYLRITDDTLNRTAALLKVSPTDVPSRLTTILEGYRKMEKELSEARRAFAKGSRSNNGSGAEIKEIAGIKFAGHVLDGVPPKELKSLVDDLKGEIGSGVVALITSNDGKASLVVGVTNDLTDKINAVDLVKAGSNALGGKGGGGRPDMAQAGGPDGLSAAKALAAIEGVLLEQA